MEAPDMNRFKALWYLAFAIFGSELIVLIANFLVFNRRTAVLLALFSIICAVLVRYIVKAVQTATPGTANIAGFGLVLFIIPLAIAAVTHLSLQREVSFADEIEASNTTNTKTYVSDVAGILEKVEDIKKTEQKTATINLGTAKIIAKNGGNIKILPPATTTNIDLKAAFSAISPKTEKTDRVSIIKDHMPLIWKTQVFGYIVLMLWCGILGLVWKHDKNQNDIDDDKEDEPSKPKSQKK